MKNPALMGICLAIPIVLSVDPKVLAIVKTPLGPWGGVLLLAAVAAWLTAVALPKTDSGKSTTR